MINKNKRNSNKSKGPWGMHEFDFTYRVKGDSLEKNRFIQAPCEDSAKEQFNYIMNKGGLEIEILDITCPDNN